MKRIVFPIIFLICLCACSRTYTPVIISAGSMNAVYNTGDFSYLCRVEWNEDNASVLVNSTRASGLVMTCDGREVTYNRNGMIRSFLIDDAPSRNPALVLYQVMSSLDTASVELVDDSYFYRGRTNAGEYLFVQRIDNTYDYIEIPSADISIHFTN